MDSKDSANTFILLHERLTTDDASLEEILTATVPATERGQDWKIVLNPNPVEEMESEEIPRSSTKAVKPLQALIFLGERHAGIIGAAAAEFYGDRFDTDDKTLEDEFLNDFQSEF